MIQKKICLLGAFSVGKTSLVTRFVKSMFSEKYLTSVGVKVDKKTVAVQGREMMLMIWDLEGEDEFTQVRTSYFRGAAGYLLVADGTRADTLTTGLTVKERLEGAIGEIPFVLLINKVDLTEDWLYSESDLDDLTRRGWEVITTSAKTGQGVEEAFLALAEKLF